MGFVGSVRREFDYSSYGAYFVTICVQDMLQLFASVVDEKLVLNPAGEMVQTVWEELPKFYPNIEIDYFFVMPNHFHGVVWILNGGSASVGEGPSALPSLGNSLAIGNSVTGGQPQGVVPTKHLSLPDVMHRFKTLTTTRYIKGVKSNNYQPFNKKLWQRSYYERVIRNETELNNIRQYIKDNPKNWLHDKYNIEKSIF